MVPAAHAAFPGQNGKIVYRSDCVWTVNPDGSGATSLTGQSTCSALPLSVSPDGRRIAYSKSPSGGGPTQVWLMNSDGSNQAQLAIGLAPTWSPDGTKIAFIRQNSSPAGYAEIWSIESDGSNLKRLIGAYPTLPVTHFYNLKWSPDGTEFAIEALDIWTVAADGSSYLRITVSAPPCCDDRAVDPTWSPDSSTIAFKHGYCLGEDFCGGPDRARRQGRDGQANHPARYF